MHSDLAPIAFLIGTWRGDGKGSFPTVDNFEYGEEITFAHAGKPHLTYTQRTWHPVKGFAMHAEMGYWRPQPDGRIEIVLAHPTGVAEILEGTVNGSTIDVASVAVTTTSTAKEVNALERTFTVDEDIMRYQVRLAAVGVPLTPHLEATLHRV